MIWIDFDDIWQKYSEDSRIEFACFSFHVDLLVITLSSLKLHTENNACMLCASVSCWTRFFLQHLSWDAESQIFVNNLRNWRSTDAPASREISLTVRWLWGLSSWLSNSDSTVSTFLSLCVCALRLPLPGRTPVDCSELHQQPVLCPTFVQKLLL